MTKPTIDTRREVSSGGGGFSAGVDGVGPMAEAAAMWYPRKRLRHLGARVGWSRRGGAGLRRGDTDREQYSLGGGGVRSSAGTHEG